MKGGDSNMEDVEEEASEEIIEKNMVAGDEGDMGEGDMEENMEMDGGKRRRKTMRRSRKSRKSRRRKTRRRRH